MKESPGKTVARNMFYQEVLPGWFSQVQLRSGNFLLLLGDEPREIPLLDKLGVSRHHIWSAERIRSVYRKQLNRDLGISLYFGEVQNYLEYLLHSNQGFQVLNLDVEGSYLTQLDPSMTSVLLYCWRNQDTIVATYSSIGRDTETLWEGVYSLAFFLWLDESTTCQLVYDLVSRYAQAGLTEPARMALRDLFWIRSHLEHTLVASSMVGTVSPRAAQQLFDCEKKVWQAVVARSRKKLSLRNLASVVQELKGKAETSFSREALSINLRINLRLIRVKNLVYNAQRPWSQRCYFTQFQPGPTSMELASWFVCVCRCFLASPLTYVNREGERFELVGRDEFAGSDVPAWTGTDIYSKFKPRQIQVRPAVQHLSLVSILRDIPQQEAHKKEVSQIMPKANYLKLVASGELTELGREVVKKLAAINTLSVADIQQLVPRLAKIAERKLRAAVAVARRKRS